MTTEISLEKLQEFLFYNPDSGKFYFKKPIGRKFAWDEAGYFDKYGYINIGLKGKKYKAHRLAWLYMTGKWPENDIDHIDNDKSHNSFSNLREATRSENKCNTKTRSDNKSGIKGISFDKLTNKWRAQIMINGKATYIGIFYLISQAEEAIFQASQKYYGEFSNHGDN